MSMNNKRFLGLLAIAVMMLLAVAPAAAQKGFTITGKVTGAADGKVYFSYTINETRVQDSVMMKNGSFTIKGKFQVRCIALCGCRAYGELSEYL